MQDSSSVQLFNFPVCSWCPNGLPVDPPEAANDNQILYPDILVPSDRVLRQPSFVASLARRVRDLDLSRRALPDFMADTIFGYSGRIIAPDGRRFCVCRVDIDDAFGGNDASFRWVSDFLRMADRLRKDPKYLAAIKDGLAQRGFKTPEQQAAAINDFMFYENWSKRTPEERAKFGVTDEALDRAKNSAGTKAVVQTHKDLKGIAPELGTRVDAGFEKDSDKAVTLEAAAYKVFAEVDKDRKPINQWSERSADVAISDPMVEAAKPAAVEAARLGDVEAAAVRPAAFKPDF